MTKVLKNIIFSGGGLKGWAYIGSIRAINEKIPFKNIEKIIGVSCGAIFGLFYLLQIDYSFILNYFLELDIKKYLDIDIDSIITNQSILQGKKFKLIIMEIMKTRINPESTFLQLFEKTGILFTVGTFNLTDINVEYFNKILTPHIKVIDAIIASSSLPLLFPAYEINNKIYYDGAVCNNCPCNLVNEENSIAFDLSCDSMPNKNNMLCLLYSMLSLLNKQYNNINKKITFKILDSRYDYETINLNQSKDDIFNIYMNGYKNTLNALDFIF